MIYRITDKNIENVTFFSKYNSVVIDSNVLLWNFYGNISYSSDYQKNIYQPLLSKIISIDGCKIYTTSINIFEIFNVVEKTEYKIYLSTSSKTENMTTLKQYRQIPKERERIKNICSLILKQISKCINIVDVTINYEDIKNFNDNYTLHKYDIFDYILLKFAKDKNINFILTDDKDFSKGSYLLDNINIMTANRNLN